MLEASVLGLKYHRVLAEAVDADFTESLKSNYDYSFIISYGSFSDHNYEITEKKSLIIILTDGGDSFFSKFSASLRNEIRKTYKIPGLQFHMKFEDFEDLYEFHKQCERERDWHPVPRNELKNSINFAVTFDGRLISAVSCYCSATRLRVGRIFSKRRDCHMTHIPDRMFSAATRRIIYEFCQYGLDKGYQTLDLGGIDLEDKTKAGIANFKMAFGGEVVPVSIGRFATPQFMLKRMEILNLGLDVT